MSAQVRIDFEYPDEMPEFCSLDEFLESNADDEYLCEEIKQLKPGESYRGGGGAVPVFTITLLKEEER